MEPFEQGTSPGNSSIADPAASMKPEKSIHGRVRINKSLLLPVLFILILWVLQFIQSWTHTPWYFLGILPREVKGLTGILTAPFIHAGYDHLLSNTMPLLVAGTSLIYFYRSIAVKVISMIWLTTGFWVWLAARPDYHIGASGLIYGFVVFLFFSGIIRKDNRLLAISLLITFLYGSLVWGILPVDQSISWESHLFGSIAGLLAAVYFRNKGPQRIKAQWELEEDAVQRTTAAGNSLPDTAEAATEKGSGEILPDDPIKINYHYRENQDQSNPDVSNKE
ncbi:MAG: rhomboid family intramembrane serine protease [Bacteroidia bacterium]|nr:rhomboid family intramembrane serine protease [Bacteroidia bacterium]